MSETIRVNFEQLAQPIFPGLPVRVKVSGPFRRRGGATFGARVGRQSLEAISFRPDGSGFVGYIASRPATGDELVLQRGDFIVETGARFTAPAGAHELELEPEAEAVALVASVPPAQSRELCRDVPRGAQRYSPDGAPIAMTTTVRSWIIENAGLTPDARAFKPAAHDKTCRVTLSVRVPRLPSGGSIRWSVPAAHRGSITLSSNPAIVNHVHTGARVEIIGLVPGVTAVDVEALDASGRALESIKFPLCVPQFVLVEDSGAASEVVFTGFNLGGEKEQVFAVAKQVCELVLAKANVRTVWNMPPFRERVPPQFNTGGIASARLTIATIAGDPPRPGLLGTTPRPSGPGVFNENIDVYPGGFDDTVTAGAASEVDDMTVAAMNCISHLTNMSTPEKEKVIQLFGRLLGETLAHEIGHSLIGPALAGATGGHNPLAGSPGALMHSLMNEGIDRSLADRTGFRPIACPINLDNAIDDGVRAINVPTGRAQTELDGHFPVPPVFA